MTPIVLPLILKMRKGSDVLNSVCMLLAKGSTQWRLKQCQEACNLGSLVVVLSLGLITVFVTVANNHFLVMETCANSVSPDTVWPVVWEDIGERIVRLFGTLHNEHDNDLKRSSSRFKVPPCLKTCTKTNLPKKQPTIENWTENKTKSPLVKYNLDSLSTFYLGALYD